MFLLLFRSWQQKVYGRIAPKMKGAIARFLNDTAKICSARGKNASGPPRRAPAQHAQRVREHKFLGDENFGAKTNAGRRTRDARNKKDLRRAGGRRNECRIFFVSADSLRNCLADQTPNANAFFLMARRRVEYRSSMAVLLFCFVFVVVVARAFVCFIIRWGFLSCDAMSFQTPPSAAHG